jgi:hypothetical protein
MRWDRHVMRSGDTRNEYKILVGKYEGTTLLGRNKCRWEDIIGPEYPCGDRGIRIVPP